MNISMGNLWKHTFDGDKKLSDFVWRSFSMPKFRYVKKFNFLYYLGFPFLLGLSISMNEQWAILDLAGYEFNVSW